MTSPSHQFGAAHQRREDLVVILTTTEIAGDAVRQLLARGIRIRHQVARGGHHEARHAERALESLLVDDALLHGTELAGPRVGEALDGHDLLAPRAMREERA